MLLLLPAQSDDRCRCCPFSTRLSRVVQYHNFVYCIVETPSEWIESDPRNDIDIECIDHITQSNKYIYRRGRTTSNSTNNPFTTVKADTDTSTPSTCPSPRPYPVSQTSSPATAQTRIPPPRCTQHPRKPACTSSPSGPSQVDGDTELSPLRKW